MTTALQLDPDRIGGRVCSFCQGWELHDFEVVGSTNLVAASFPVWSAVRACRQTGGRGRFQRTWISDSGGLWLSAVVPAGDDTVARRALPLAAGLAVCNGLRELGVTSLRLRWPNDVMLNERKLAGLLIDQFRAGSAVVGIGLNVRNQPEASDRSLNNHVARLAEVMNIVPELDTLTEIILRHLRGLLATLDRDGTQSLFEQVNRVWGPSRTVELDLDGRLIRGRFAGIDPLGRLILVDPQGNQTCYDAHEVRHLTET